MDAYANHPTGYLVKKPQYDQSVDSVVRSLSM